MREKMSFPTVNPTETASWKALETHYKALASKGMQTALTGNESRAKAMSVSWQDFFFDYAKNRITEETFSLLMDLAKEVELKTAIDMQFAGERINATENRAVLHTALRNFDAMKPEVSQTLEKIKQFSEAVISGTYKGFSGKPITDIVNIGIGGSHLGPEMVVEALHHYSNHLGIHFIANVDGDNVQDILSSLNPETTLVIVVSKSFTTQETLTNATVVKDWFLQKGTKEAIARHFVAVSMKAKEAVKFGVAESNVFPMYDWVGGRFSLWGAVGLSISCALGYHRFEELLKGGFEMDKHFQTTEFHQNIPVILGLLSVWYNNFFKVETEGIVAYSEYLHKLVPYLQQAVMESNGKSVDRNGTAVDYQTGTIAWGDVGSNAQHAFFQLLHQGTKWVPTDFIGFSQSLQGNTKNHNILMANFFAQTESLWEGKPADPQNPYTGFEGNRPSNTLLIKKLTPKNLGSLIALYEHKVFVQGVIWNIYSYDQWGVELGKKVARGTLQAIVNQNPDQMTNSSTQQLLKQYLQDQAENK